MSKANAAELARLSDIDGPTEEEQDAFIALEKKLDDQADCVSYMRHSIQNTGGSWYAYNIQNDHNLSQHPVVKAHRERTAKRTAFQDKISARKKARR